MLKMKMETKKKMTILFTFDSDETGCQYVVFQDPDLDEAKYMPLVMMTRVN